MQSSLFAICDPEEAYAARLAAYLTETGCTPFEVQPFTEPSALLSYAKTCPVELLLIHPSVLTPALRALPVGLRVLLLEDSDGSAFAADGPAICKYQSAAGIARQAMDLYASSGPHPDLVLSPHRRTAVYGVYSPVHRCGKTSFALTLGSVLARNLHVLYLNLEPYAGFEDLFQRTWNLDLLDLLYFFREQDGSFLFRLSSIVQSFSNLQFVPPAASSQEFIHVSGAEWLALLDAVAGASDFDAIILDIGDLPDGLFPLLARCSTVYMPVLDDAVSRAKLAQFERALSLYRASQLTDKIRRLTLPCHALDTASPDLLQQLARGEMGRYVRALLQDVTPDALATGPSRLL